MKFRIWCDFEIEAENEDEVIEQISWDTDFISEHIIIEKADEPNRIVIPVFYYREGNKKVFDTEEMRREFERQLKKVVESEN